MGKADKKEDKEGRRFSQEQYDLLISCSEKKDVMEWNKWYTSHTGEDILLEYADFGNAELESVILDRGNLQGADLSRANLKGARFWDAHLEGAKLPNAHLEGASLVDAHLEGADLSFANLHGAELMGANLEGANLYEANMKNVKLWKVYLRDAKLISAHLEDAEFIDNACLQNANFTAAIVNGGTLIWDCEVDPLTDFSGVGLDSMRIDPGTKQLLEYNTRRMSWKKWYKWKDWYKYNPETKRQKASQVLRWPVRAFWAMSDYGRSTLRVVGVFFLLAFLFAAVYMNWGYWASPGIVSNLVVQPEVGEAGWHYFGRALIRPIYFSVVTMTTLGFGDMYANKGSIAGHVLLILQVILGYVLLGALITRFAVLFTAGGPAGKFAEGKKDE